MFLYEDLMYWDNDFISNDAELTIISLKLKKFESFIPANLRQRGKVSVFLGGRGGCRPSQMRSNWGGGLLLTAVWFVWIVNG